MFCLSFIVTLCMVDMLERMMGIVEIMVDTVVAMVNRMVMVNRMDMIVVMVDMMDKLDFKLVTFGENNGNVKDATQGNDKEDVERDRDT